MSSPTLRKVALSSNIACGLLSGDAMANHNMADDWAAYKLLSEASRTERPYEQIIVLQAEDNLLHHIVDYLDALADPDVSCRDRFGFTKAEARAAAELLAFQLDKQ